MKTAYAAASMGPQHTRCGKRVRRAAQEDAVSRFNGAATYSLRKAAACLSASARRRGFNGAATYSLRKVREEFDSGDVMTQLQWGRNILVAESCSRPYSRNSRTRASMGPQHTRCGKPGGEDVHAGDNPASMGPQHTRCGKLHLQRAARDVFAASMGPQHTRCGKCGCGSRRFRQMRCFNGAATYSLRKAAARWSPSSWRRRFNGAATYSLRKVPDVMGVGGVSA